MLGKGWELPYGSWKGEGRPFDRGLRNFVTNFLKFRGARKYAERESEERSRISKLSCFWDIFIAELKQKHTPTHNNVAGFQNRQSANKIQARAFPHT